MQSGSVARVQDAMNVLKGSQHPHARYLWAHIHLVRVHFMDVEVEAFN